MATIRQSIEIRVPVHTAYQQLTRFEDYPRFMQEVDDVTQLDDTHLHWTSRMANRPVEWDAEITEQQPGRCIAWHNTGGPVNAGRIDVEAMGEEASRVTFTLRAEPQQVPGSMAGNQEQDLALRLQTDLARLKEMIEARGPQSHAAAPVQGGASTSTASGQESGPVAGLGIAQGTGLSGDMAGREGIDQVAVLGSVQGSAQMPVDPAPPASATTATTDTTAAAGSEGIDVDAEIGSPAASASSAAERRNDSAGTAQASPQQARPHTGTGQAQPTMRHLGQLPQDTTADEHGGVPTSDAVGKHKPEDR